ncbi:hypothetical protein HK098_005882 [Nowakowskiella sp. JEL0407]|nr:hypothetical protein HK098_005882 [Nowakowskiella sp. JEL0407]
MDPFRSVLAGPGASLALYERLAPYSGSSPPTLPFGLNVGAADDQTTESSSSSVHLPEVPCTPTAIKPDSSVKMSIEIPITHPLRIRLLPSYKHSKPSRRSRFTFDPNSLFSRTPAALRSETSDLLNSDSDDETFIQTLRSLANKKNNKNLLEIVSESDSEKPALSFKKRTPETRTPLSFKKRNAETGKPQISGSTDLRTAKAPLVSRRKIVKKSYRRSPPPPPEPQSTTFSKKQKNNNPTASSSFKNHVESIKSIIQKQKIKKENVSDDCIPLSLAHTPHTNLRAYSPELDSEQINDSVTQHPPGFPRNSEPINPFFSPTSPSYIYDRPASRISPLYMYENQCGIYPLSPSYLIWNQSVNSPISPTSSGAMMSNNYGETLQSLGAATVVESIDSIESDVAPAAFGMDESTVEMMDVTTTSFDTQSLATYKNLDKTLKVDSMIKSSIVKKDPNTKTSEPPKFEEEIFTNPFMKLIPTQTEGNNEIVLGIPHIAHIPKIGIPAVVDNENENDNVNLMFLNSDLTEPANITQITNTNTNQNLTYSESLIINTQLNSPDSDSHTITPHTEFNLHASTLSTKDNKENTGSKSLESVSYEYKGGMQDIVVGPVEFGSKAMVLELSGEDGNDETSSGSQVGTSKQVNDRVAGCKKCKDESGKVTDIQILMRQESQQRQLEKLEENVEIGVGEMHVDKLTTSQELEFDYDEIRNFSTQFLIDDCTRFFRAGARLNEPAVDLEELARFVGDADYMDDEWDRGDVGDGEVQSFVDEVGRDDGVGGGRGGAKEVVESEVSLRDYAKEVTESVVDKLKFESFDTESCDEPVEEKVENAIDKNFENENCKEPVWTFKSERLGDLVMNNEGLVYHGKNNNLEGINDLLANQKTAKGKMNNIGMHVKTELNVDELVDIKMINALIIPKFEELEDSVTENQVVDSISNDDNFGNIRIIIGQSSASSVELSSERNNDTEININNNSKPNSIHTNSVKSSISPQYIKLGDFLRFDSINPDTNSNQELKTASNIVVPGNRKCRDLETSEMTNEVEEEAGVKKVKVEFEPSLYLGIKSGFEEKGGKGYVRESLSESVKKAFAKFCQ